MKIDARELAFTNMFASKNFGDIPFRVPTPHMMARFGGAP
jgi:hypothetical protein